MQKTLIVIMNILVCVLVFEHPVFAQDSIAEPNELETITRDNIWKLESIRQFGTIVTDIKVSPNSSSFYVIQSGQIAIYDFKTFEIQKILKGYSNAVWPPTHQQLGLISADGFLELWDISDFQLIDRYSFPEVASLSSIKEVVWSADGDFITIQSPGKSGYQILQTFNITENLPLLSEVEVELAPVIWSPTGDKLAITLSSDESHVAAILDIKTGEKTLLSDRATNTDRVRLAWSRDGQYLVEGIMFENSRCNEAISILYVWNIQTYEPVGQVLLELCQTSTFSISNSGNWIAVSNHEEGISIWDIEQQNWVRYFESYSGTYESIAWSPDDSTVVVIIEQDDGTHIVDMKMIPDSESTDSKLYVKGQGYTFNYPNHPSHSIEILWSQEYFETLFKNEARFASDRPDVESNRVLFIEYDEREILLSPTGSMLAVREQGNYSNLRDKIGIWDFDSGTLLSTLNEEVLNYTVHSLHNYDSMAWSPDEKYLASASGRNNYVHIWDISDGGILNTIRSKTTTNFGLAWSPDGKSIAWLGDNLSIQIYDPFTGKRISSFGADQDLYLPYRFKPNSIQWSEDSSVIRFRGQSWDVENATLVNPIIAEFDHKRKEVILSACELVLIDDTFEISNLRTYCQCQAIPKDKIEAGTQCSYYDWNLQMNIKVLEHAYQSDITIASPNNRFSAVKPSNRSLGVMILDGEFPLWSIPAYGKLDLISWSPNSDMLATKAQNRPVQVWDVSSADLLRTFEHVSSIQWLPDGTGVIAQNFNGQIEVYGVNDQLDLNEYASGINYDRYSEASQLSEYLSLIPPKCLELDVCGIEGSVLVQIDNLNIRTGPGTDFFTIDQANIGSLFSVFGTDEKQEWLMICCINDSLAWIINEPRYIDVEGDLNLLPRVNLLTAESTSEECYAPIHPNFTDVFNKAGIAGNQCPIESAFLENLLVQRFENGYLMFVPGHNYVVTETVYVLYDEGDFQRIVYEQFFDVNDSYEVTGFEIPLIGKFGYVWFNYLSNTNSRIGRPLEEEMTWENVQVQHFSNNGIIFEHPENGPIFLAGGY